MGEPRDFSAQINDRADRNTEPLEVKGRVVGRIVVGEEDNFALGCSGVNLGVFHQRVRQHDARHIIARKNNRPFNRAGGEDHLFGPYHPVPLARLAGTAAGLMIGDPLDGGKRIAVVTAPDMGSGQNAQVWKAGKGCNERGGESRHGLLINLARRMAQRAADLWIFIRKHHIQPARSRRLRRLQSRRTRADDQNVAEGVHPLVAVRVGDKPRFSQACGAADEFLAEHPEFGVPERAHKGLVIEARREKFSGQRVDGADVESQRGEAVLAFRRQPFKNLDLSRFQVGLAQAVSCERHQCVRLLGASGKKPSRAVIFEGAAEQHDAVRQQRRSQRVALEAAIALAVERERKGPGAVDGRSACGQSPEAHFAPQSLVCFTSRISWVSVLRSTIRCARQPPWCCQNSLCQPRGLARW